MNPYILLLTAILFGVSGQLLLKLGMERQWAFRFVETIGLLHNWPVLMGFGCYGISTLLYFPGIGEIGTVTCVPHGEPRLRPSHHPVQDFLQRNSQPDAVDGGHDHLRRRGLGWARITLILNFD